MNAISIRSARSLPVLAALLASAVLGCSGAGSKSSSSDLSGNYVGVLGTTGLCGSGNVTATLFQSGSTISGTWTTTGFGTTFPCTLNYSGGTVSGAVFDRSVSLTLTKNNSAFTLTGTSDGSGTISGTFTQSFSVGNGASTGGTFSLARQ